MAEIRLNDNGWTLRLTIEENGAAVDVSTMTLASALRLIPPKGSTKLRTPTFAATGADGRIEYITQPGDFDQVGRWRVQVAVVLPGPPALDLKSSALILDVQRVNAS